MIHTIYIQVTVYDFQDDITPGSRVTVEGLIEGNRRGGEDVTIGLSCASGLFSDINDGITFALESLKKFHHMGLPVVRWRHFHTQTTGVYKNAPELKELYNKGKTPNRLGWAHV